MVKQKKRRERRESRKSVKRQILEIKEFGGIWRTTIVTNFVLFCINNVVNL